MRLVLPFLASTLRRLPNAKTDSGKITYLYSQVRALPHATLDRKWYLNVRNVGKIGTFLK